MSSLTEPTTPPSSDPGTDLARWISHKRTGVEHYLVSTTSRRRRLLNLTIITGTCAAALTAAPALGGKFLTDWLTMTLGLSSPSWKLLCGIAAACSLTATITTQLLKSHNMEERITCANDLRAQLETLEVGITSRKLNSTQAANQYMTLIRDAPFIHEVP